MEEGLSWVFLVQVVPKIDTQEFGSRIFHGGVLEQLFLHAYTNSDISGKGNGCALWFGDLVDIRQFSDGGQDLYIRMRAWSRGRNEDVHSDVAQEEDLDLPMLDFSTVAHATHNFSENTKLGEGGFGPVYKGILADGQTIPIKEFRTRT